MKHFFIAVSVCQDGKNCAYLVKTTSSENLVSLLKKHNTQHANIYHTKKEAVRVVNHWNACYKANNCYMFSDPLLF